MSKVAAKSANTKAAHARISGCLEGRAKNLERIAARAARRRSADAAVLMLMVVSKALDSMKILQA